MAAYSIGQVASVFGDVCVKQQLLMPFTQDTLTRCAQSHLLIPGVPLSILEMRERRTDLFSRHDWYTRERHDFSKRPLECRWYLLRIGAVPDSAGKPWNEQVSLLAPGEVVAPAELVILGMTLHQVLSRKCIFGGSYVRTASELSDRDHVNVSARPFGIDLYSFTGKCGVDQLSLAAMVAPTEPCTLNS